MQNQDTSFATSEWARGEGEYYISNQKLRYCWAGSSSANKVGAVLIAGERYLIN